MASNIDFRALLGVPVTSAEKPKPLPAGVYFAQVLGFETTASSQKGTPGVKISFRLTGPDADVDMEQLEAAGGQAVLQKRKVSTTFWLTEDSTYRLREFLEGPCNIEVGDRSFGEALAEIRDLSVKVVLSQRITDKQDVIMEVDQVLAA